LKYAVRASKASLFPTHTSYLHPKLVCSSLISCGSVSPLLQLHNHSSLQDTDPLRMNKLRQTPDGRSFTWGWGWGGHQSWSKNCGGLRKEGISTVLHCSNCLLKKQTEGNKFLPCILNKILNTKRMFFYAKANWSLEFIINVCDFVAGAVVLMESGSIPLKIQNFV